MPPYHGHRYYIPEWHEVAAYNRGQIELQNKRELFNLLYALARALI
jgi:hypothetical protein